MSRKKSYSDWDEAYKVLLDFAKTHGHCDVPAIYPKNTALGRWVREQRLLHVGNKLNTYRTVLLDKLAFSWEIGERKWLKQFNDLKSHQKKAKNFKFNIKNKHQRLLSAWARMQRLYYKKGMLSKKRVKLLESIGFEWNPQLNNWLKNAGKIKTLIEKGKVKDLFKLKSTNKKLYNWLLLQIRLNNIQPFMGEKLDWLNKLIFK